MTEFRENCLSGFKMIAKFNLIQPIVTKYIIRNQASKRAAGKH